MSEISPKQDLKSAALAAAQDVASPEIRSPVRHVEIDRDHDGQRIDNYLKSLLKTVPRSLVYRILRTGQVRVNKGRIKPSFRLSEGDIVRLPPLTQPIRQKARVPKSVLRQVEASVIDEDCNWIVIDKPAGLAVHAGTGVEFGIIDAIKEVFDEPSISLVHRLDRSTSGVMLLARNRSASSHFHHMLVSGDVSKHYSALLCGVLQKPRTVSARLRKTHPTANENHVLIDPENGKTAISHFKCRTAGKRFCLADIEIETGRTHQIRVHAASIRHPVLGDERYGDEKLNKSVRHSGSRRMFLHARELSFPDLGADAPRRAYTVPVQSIWQDVLQQS